MRRVTGQIVLASTAITLLTAAIPVGQTSSQTSKPVPEEIRMAQAPTAMDERKLKSALSKLDRTVKRAERNVETYEEYKSDRTEASTLKAITSARELLALISSAGESKDLERRLNAVMSRYDAVRSDVANADAVKANQQAAINDMDASGELERDYELAQALDKTLGDRFRYKFDSTVFGRRGTYEQLDALVAETQNWDEDIKAFDVLKSKYGAITGTDNWTLKRLQSSVYEIKQSLPIHKKWKDAFEEQALDVVRSSLDDAAKIAEEAIDEGNFKAFTGLNSEMRMALIKPEAVTRVYEALSSVSARDSKTVRVAYEDGLATIDRLKDKARDKIIAENRFDPDNYSGSDAAVIKAKAKDGFEAIHGKQDIIEIRIPAGQWARHEGFRWSKIDKAYSKFDYSTIDAFVFERTDKKVATYWRVTIQKRHLEGDAIIADPASRNRHKPTPDQQILLSNL